MLTITPIPAFMDNYFWLMHQNDPSCHQAYIVDPGDGQVVHQTLQHYGLTLAGILITHHHYDHIDGIDFLSKTYGSDTQPIPVYGPQTPKIPQINQAVFEGDKICLFAKYSLTVMETPGHTPEHICYYSNDVAAPTILGAPILFCGDTLFAAGCGRLKGGSAEQLYSSLQRILTLPEDTHIYCAHEYTLANLHFAQTVEPNNNDIDQRMIKESLRRHNNIPTIPFSLAIEKRTNPFLRTHLANIQNKAAQYASEQKGEISNALSFQELTTFTILRHWKDQF